jgi:broad specificity phosphatase PhoE
MRVGLIRHFRVEQPLPGGWRTAAELHAWRSRYDLSRVTPVSIDLGAKPWASCWSSDLERAVLTAKAVFGGPIEYTPLLREADFAEFRTGALRLPLWVWRQLLRAAWLTGHQSQRACRDEFLRRVRLVAERIESQQNDLLVVSHAGMMAYLSAELRRRGFVGRKLRVAEPATLHVYERIASACSPAAGPARLDPTK